MTELMEDELRPRGVDVEELTAALAARPRRMAKTGPRTDASPSPDVPYAEHHAAPTTQQSTTQPDDGATLAPPPTCFIPQAGRNNKMHSASPNPDRTATPPPQGATPRHEAAHHPVPPPATPEGLDDDMGVARDAAPTLAPTSG